MEKKKDPKKPKKLEKKKIKQIATIVISLAAIVILNIICMPKTKTAQYELTEQTFGQYIEQGLITTVEIQSTKDEYGNGFKIYLNIGSNGHSESYSLFIPKKRKEHYEELFRKYEIRVKNVKKSYVVLTSSFIIGGFAIFFILAKKANQRFNLKGVEGFKKEWSGLTGFGGNAESKTEEEKPKTKFKDVAGCDEAKAEVQEIVEFLINPEKFTRLGGKMPKGILLVGLPGTGKTLLARAMAGEANVPMLTRSGSDFINTFVGVGPRNVRSLFDEAEKKAPCIIFIDEADSIGARSKGSPDSSGKAEEGRTVDAMLTRMDGFKPNIGIVLVLATNRPDMLDKALIRPGRIDRQVIVNKPDKKGREAILIVHARTRVMSPNKNNDLKHIAKISTGLVGADLENIINEAAIYAAKNKDRKHIKLSDLEHAFEKVMSGAEQKSKIISEEEKRRIAYHEAGHTIVAEILLHALTPRKVSIMPRGLGALGQTMLMPEEEKQLTTKDEIMDNISVLYGGRVAEEIIYNNCSTGSQNDQERATKSIKQIICVFGMDESVGMRTFGKAQNSYLEGQMWTPSTDYGEEKKKQIDDAIDKLTKERYEVAKEIVSLRKDILEKMANELVEKETLGRKEILEIIRGNK